jgi:hypothetical protein
MLKERKGRRPFMDVLVDVWGQGGWSVSTTAVGMIFFTYYCSMLENKANYKQYLVKTKLR